MPRPKLMQQKTSGVQKAAGGHFEYTIWIDIISINMLGLYVSCFFTVIKTVSIYCKNWTDQLLFTYKIALCASHSHSFVCWHDYSSSPVLIKFSHLTDRLYEEVYSPQRLYLIISLIEENTAKYTLSFSRNFSFLMGLFLCRTLYILPFLLFGALVDTWSTVDYAVDYRCLDQCSLRRMPTVRIYGLCHKQGSKTQH